MSSSYPLLYGLFAEVQDQCILISGKTFESKDLLKSLGGIWVPELKKWKLPHNADLSSLQPQVKLSVSQPLQPPRHQQVKLSVSQPLQPPRPSPLPKTNFLGRVQVGRCCQKCQVMFDKKKPEGPLWYVCSDHGTWQNNYSEYDI